MPARLVDKRAGKLEDICVLRFDYPRATPEKALLDWIYLGQSPRSRMTRPPFDLEVEALEAAAIGAEHGLERPLQDWMAQYRRLRH